VFSWARSSAEDGGGATGEAAVGKYTVGEIVDLRIGKYFLPRRSSRGWFDAQHQHRTAVARGDDSVRSRRRRNLLPQLRHADYHVDTLDISIQLNDELLLSIGNPSTARPATKGHGPERHRRSPQNGEGANSGRAAKSEKPPKLKRTAK